MDKGLYQSAEVEPVVSTHVADLGRSSIEAKSRYEDSKNWQYCRAGYNFAWSGIPERYFDSIGHCTGASDVDEEADGG